MDTNRTPILMERARALVGGPRPVSERTCEAYALLGVIVARWEAGHLRIEERRPHLTSRLTRAGTS